MSNHSFFAPSRSAFGALCQTSRSRQRAKSSRAAAVEPQLAPLCGRSLLVSFPLFTHCLSNTAGKNYEPLRGDVSAIQAEVSLPVEHRADAVERECHIV